MARTDPQVNFRIPAELKHQLESSALNAGRTLTAEMVMRLNFSFEFGSHIGINDLGLIRDAKTNKFDFEHIFNSRIDELLKEKLEQASLLIDDLIQNRISIAKSLK